jgi:hypothetical protein
MIEFEVNKSGVTLGALIGSTSLEVKGKADELMLYELKRDIPGYLEVSSELVVILENPENGVKGQLERFLDERGISPRVWIVEI